MPRKKAEAPAAAPEEKITGGPQEETQQAVQEAAQQEAEQEAAESSPEAGTEAQAAPVEDSPAETASMGHPAVVRSPKGLNLRAGPALSYEVREVLPDGAEVTALDLPMGAEVPGWRLVSDGKMVGWCQSRFLRLEG